MDKKNNKKIDDLHKDPFEEYLKIGEPEKVDKAYAWQTAVGLQDVDKLSTSDYLMNTARENIEGEISIDEAKRRIDSYYKESAEHKPERTEEADKVSVRIAEILSEKSFVFSPTQYISIHRRLFLGIYSHAGKIRDYDISKREWVLDGASVMYGGANELRETLEYDFNTEREFDYSGRTMSEIISHLTRFVSNLWQIHIFGEGNTRTTAVFFIKYLRSLGFNVTNDVFAKNAWYFRNSLVRANYTNIQKGIHEDRSFLEVFLKNLLMGENNELKNRYMHIAWKETTHSDGKQHIEQHIERHIEHHIQEKNDLLSILNEQAVSPKAKANILKLYESFGLEKIFGRTDVVEVLSITEKPATTLLGKMYSLKLTEKIIGAGKGKYRFIV
ncbi:MAG: Fic family protein [Lachnospiraceae bacterium]|nr:Fic family protein [Lachnospiraceae bacterium]